MNLLLDTTILGRLCHPKQAQNKPVAQWLAGLLASEDEDLRVFVPEIADYELRRKLLHLISKKQATQQSIDRLDALAAQLEFLPLSTDTMRRAAEMWAEARSAGLPTAADEALDGDVILAAQTESVGGIVLTENPKHLQRFVVALNWPDVQTQGIDQVPFVEGILPPRGFIRAQQTDGTQFWVRPGAMKKDETN